MVFIASSLFHIGRAGEPVVNESCRERPQDERNLFTGIIGKSQCICMPSDVNTMSVQNAVAPASKLYYVASRRFR